MTQTENMYRELGISPAVYAFGQEIEKGLKERFDRIDETAEYNQLKVVGAMQKTVWRRPASQLPAAMAITIWEEISWRKFTLRRFTQRRPWCALRSPAVRTLWQ